MLKPKHLHVVRVTILQPVPTFRPRLVFSREEGARSDEAKQQPPRILVVEDDYLISTEMEAELTAAGFDVVGVASSAREAIRLAHQERPHLVVMDIRLEGTSDGVEAAIEIFNSHGIRSIFASAYYDAETRRRAQPSSPLGWLPKPYTMDSLVSAVRAALRDLEGTSH